MATKLSFTKSFIDSVPLPQPGRRGIYEDTKVPALQLRVGSAGSKTFSVYRRMKGGAPERITLGKYPSLTIEQARRQAAVVNLKIEGGANPAQVRRERRGELTFAALFQEYLERHARPNKRSVSLDESHFRRHLASKLGPKPISEITRQHIVTLHAEITRAGQPVEANRLLALVSSVYGRALNWGLVKENVARGICRNPEASRDRFLQTVEFPIFAVALNAEANEIIRDYIWMSLFTGARRSNVLSMRWADLNLDEKTWRIGRTKNGTPQNVHLSSSAVSLLLARKESAENVSEFVFPGTGRTGHLVEPKKGWQRVLSAAEIEDFHLHDLRRTFGSWQAKTGASLPIIGKSLNHKSPLTTAIYARLDLDPVRASVDLATNAMLQAAGLKRPTNGAPEAVVDGPERPL